ncbi:DUF6049 family protein [Streptacidiphilus sp. MAP12-20]|uniref:DUF6049 family protein n=1 Tax=Streptacidiphilus sp. MAP12-20 TaxID=3156299 RepID=UPI0035150C31
MRRGGRLQGWGRLTLASGLVLLAGPTLAPAAEAAPQIKVTEVPGSAPAAAGTAPRGTGLTTRDSNVPIDVTLDTVLPAAPAPTGQVTLTGTVTNRGTSTIDGLHVGLTTTGRAVRSRSEIETTIPNGKPSDLDGLEIDDPSLQAKIGALVPGASAPFTITAPVGKLRLGTGPDGVYVLGVDAQSTVGATAGRTLGITRTFLPIHPASSTDKPTKVATLWPLTDAPKIQAQTYLDPSGVEEPVLTDDNLAASLAQEGRLNQLTGIGQANPGLHLSWVIDPDLIDTVYAMTKNYQVAGPAADAQGANNTCNCLKKGTGSDAASAWLSSLQNTLTQPSKADVISLPYADPDLASLAHNAGGGPTLSALLPLTTSALGLDRLQVDAAHNVAWPYQGAVDTSIERLAKTSGANQIIVNGTSLPDSQNLNYTPNAARSIGNGMTAVVADGALAKIFAGDLSSKSAQTAATQQFLAETLAITQERPDQQRFVLVQPPRQMSTATAQTLATALTDAQSGKWVSPTDLKSVVQAGATPGANTSVPQSYPAQLRSTEISADAFDGLLRSGERLAWLEQILTRPDRLREPFSAAMVRSVSTAWRENASAGSDYRQSMGGYVSTLGVAVKILPKATDVVVPGNNSSAQVAVTVENDLEQTVGKMRLSLTSSAPKRLQVNTSDYDVSVTGGRTKKTYKFKVTTTANGTVPMTATLYSTQDGHQISQIPFKVNATSVSTGVITVIAGGGLLVVLAGLRLYWKRKKNAALEAANSENQEP